VSIFPKSWLAAGILIAACATMLAPAAAWAQSADVQVTKTGPATVQPGANATYTITVTNNGPNAAANVGLVDAVPPGTTFVSISSNAGWTAANAGGVITETNNVLLASGASATFTLVLQVSSSAGATTTISNTASVSSPTADPIPGNNNSTTTATVTAGPATHFSVSAPAAATGGTSFPFTVTARDVANNVATGYVGTVRFTSTDGGATLPSNYTFVGGDSGVHTFSATLATAGSQTITATDTTTSSITGTSGTINVTGPATHFSVAAPATATAGAPFNVTVTALNAGGTTATSYAGTVHFTSTDGAAVLPANSTLTNGVGTFSTTLNTSGSRTITATDTVTSAITGTSGPINVGINATSTTLTSSQNPSQVGQAVTFTATASSSGGTPTGTITFKDGAVVLGTATVAAGGIATFTTSTLALGSHSITASYAGTTNFAASNSATLVQTVNTPTDSLKLRALQVLATPVAAQTSGMAISGAVDNAITEGFSDGGALVTPNAGGVRFNFAADPDGKPASTARSTDPFSSANGSFASNGRGFAREPSSRAEGASPSHIDDTFGALAYAGPTKAPPLRVAEPREWLGWAEVRGATLDHWGTGASGTVVGAPMLYGDQVNLLAGLTRKFTPNFLIGVLGGYETFDYRSDALQGRLKGDGWTVGSYLGWRITEGIRFDVGAAYSGIGYNGTAGTAAGSFNGNRWLVTSGLTGIYRAYGFQIEPSARVYALWEHENAYTDTLGTLQAARDFSTGRASGGMKLSYPIAWSTTAILAPYVGLYGDYYFNSDNAGTLAAAAVAIPANIILDGWSARAVAGLTAQFNNGALIALGGERAGIGGNFGLWTYRARASVPFAAQ
jgi:uncharacterized repeat protein (TIGR01451 family)